MSNDDKKGMYFFFLISDTWIQGIHVAVSFSILVIAIVALNSAYRRERK